MIPCTMRLEGNTAVFNKMSWLKLLLIGALWLEVVACAASELAPLVLEGHELHAALVTRQIDKNPDRHVSRAIIAENPCLSAEADVVEAIARSGSQGQLGGEGIRHALYALYGAESDLGLYGLEAGSEADADRLEKVLREVWAHNVSIGRARVHRGHLALVVMWHDGVPLECWEAANSQVAERVHRPE